MNTNLTSFTIPYHDHEIPHSNMDCESALNLIRKNQGLYPYRYFSAVKIKLVFERSLLNPFATVIDRYQLLSHEQFECLLTCAKASKHKWNYQECKRKCLSQIDIVRLNELDCIRLKKNPPD